MISHPAATAIAQRLSACFQRGMAAPAMSMEKLSEIVSDGLESCAKTTMERQGIEELEKLLDTIAIRLADISEDAEYANPGSGIQVETAAGLVHRARMILVEKIRKDNMLTYTIEYWKVGDHENRQQLSVEDQSMEDALAKAKRTMVNPSAFSWCICRTV